MTGPWELVLELLSPSDRTGTTGKELREAKLGKPDSLKGEILEIKNIHLIKTSDSRIQQQKENHMKESVFISSPD